VATLGSIVENNSTVPAWLAVVLPIATLLIGAAVPLVTQRLQREADREARQEQRGEARDRERRERQRAALYELQEAIGQLATLLAIRALPTEPPIDSTTLLNTIGRAVGLSFRIHDEELRDLTKNAMVTLVRGPLSGDEELNDDASDRMGSVQRRIEELLGELD
jgi:hypothetical protein